LAGNPLEDGSLSDCALGRADVETIVVVVIAILLDPEQGGLSSEHKPFLCPDPSVILAVGIGAFVIVEGREVVAGMDKDVDIDEDVDMDDDVVDVDLDDMVEVDVDEVVGVMYICAELVEAHSFLRKYLPLRFALQQQSREVVLTNVL
jgi:hypothetical protein